MNCLISPYSQSVITTTNVGYFGHFTFNGNGTDYETGYSYFGARYMDHELMTMWLSVDPMADKYPNISPYAYCSWNPVRLVDPDGRDWYEKTDEDGNKSIEWCKDKKSCPKDGRYLGEKGCTYNQETGHITYYQSDGRISHYRGHVQNSNTNGSYPLGEMSASFHNGSAKFGSSRGNRKHAGCDMYSSEGTPVFSIKDGRVTELSGNYYKGSSAIAINHGSFTARYCEIVPAFDLNIGTDVSEGQFLGITMPLNIQQTNNCMLHFEMYSNQAAGPLTQQGGDYRRRSDLMDPTSYLDNLSVIPSYKCNYR